MASETTRTSVQLVSRVRSNGELELSLESTPVAHPAPNEVVMRVGAAPINPSDLLLLFAGADPATLQASGSAERPVLSGKVPGLASLRQRFDQPLAVGNEGAGVVVEAGSSAQAQALLGKVVAAAPGTGMYAEYRVLPAALCIPLNEGTTAIAGASACVNPLTVLGFIETMRREGHSGLANTAAASNLGQMLVRLCLKDGIPLVNIVRSPKQVELLASLGAKYICDSSAPTFLDDLTEAFAATGVTLAFDAVGGGKLPGQLLSCMESAINRQSKSFSRYGSSVHKQVYLYGGLDPSPTELVRSFGLTWGLGGWLVMNALATLEPSRLAAMRQRIADELSTTFASSHARTLSLAQALDPELVLAYAKRATGEKYLILPNGP